MEDIFASDAGGSADTSAPADGADFSASAGPPSDQRYGTGGEDGAALLMSADSSPDPPDGGQLSVVQRIRAMREGRLTFPDITTPETAEADEDRRGVSAAEKTREGTCRAAELKQSEDDNPAPTAAEGDGAAHLRESIGRITKNKTAMAISALIVAGGVLYAAGPGRSADNENNTAGTRETVQQNMSPDSSGARSSSAAQKNPAVVADGPLLPASAAASHDVCTTGSTSGMDGFIRDKNKNHAWACVNPFGIIPGTTLTIELPAMSAITTAGAIPGFNGKSVDGTDNWPRYPLVTSARWYFGDGPGHPEKFSPARELQSITLDEPVYGRVMPSV